MHNAAELHRIVASGTYPVMILSNAEMNDFALIDVSGEFTEEMQNGLRKRGVTLLAGVAAIVQGQPEAAITMPLGEAAGRMLAEAHLQHIAASIGAVANA